MSTVSTIQLIATIFAFAVSFSLEISAEEAKKAPQPTLLEVTIPDDLKVYLTQSLPDFEPVTKEDYESDRIDGNTGLCWSVAEDFDGNGMTDFALLMIGSVEGKRHLSLIAVRAGERGWRHDILRSYALEREISDRIGLESAGPVFMGYKKNGQERIKSLANPSLVMGGLDQCSAYRYYWKNGKWHDAYIRR